MDPLMTIDAHSRRAELIGSRIRLARRALGLSQEQLAQLLDDTRGHIAHWEDGRQEPRASNLERLSEQLNQPLWFFFGGPPRGD